MTGSRRSCVLGIDVGTTHIKAVVFDGAGVEVAKRVLDTPSHSDGAGQTVWDPDAVWARVAEATRLALQASAGDSGALEPVGVAVASVGESGAALDREGRSLYPIIAWFDPRTSPQAKWWSDHIGQAKTSAITGLSIKTLYSALKILWLFEHVDGLRDNIRSWLPVSSFIEFKLTGSRVMDLSQASRTLLFDQAKLAWSEELLAASGIPVRILPEVVPAGTLVGRVTREASAATGIPAGVPVFAGGHDHVCGALAAGVVGPGVVLDSCGTAESILASCEDAARMELVCASGFSFGHHVARGTRYAMGGLLSSGGAVEWFMRELGAPARSYEELALLAARSKPGAAGVMFVPRILGSGPPTRDERATGAFARIRPHATRADLARAVFEGLSFELKTAFRALESALGRPLSRIVTIGGGARNDLWLLIKACVLGLPIEVPEVTESSALGAALLAGIGSGLYRDAEDAFSRTLRIARRVAPDESLVRSYERAYDVYTEVSDALYRVDISLQVPSRVPMVTGEGLGIRETSGGEGRPACSWRT